MDSCLANLRQWISQSPHLHSMRQDDQGSLPEWYSDWDPELPGVADLLTAGVFLPLPGYDRKGCFVILCRFGRISPDRVRTEDLLKTSNMVTGLAMEGNEQASIRGFVMVNDLSGVKTSHLGLFGPSTV